VVHKLFPTRTSMRTRPAIMFWTAFAPVKRMARRSSGWKVILLGALQGSTLLRTQQSLRAPRPSVLVNLANYIWVSRKAWLGPLIAALLIMTAMFVVARGPVDIPFVYRSAK
jgi:hypothetical protein